MASTNLTQAADLQVGDVIDLIGGADVIAAVRPYEGPLVDLAGARIATLGRGRQITLEPTARFVRLFEAA